MERVTRGRFPTAEGDVARCCGVVGCAEDGRVRDAAPTQDWDGSVGMVTMVMTMG